MFISEAGTEISRKPDENEHSSPNRNENFLDKIASLSQHSGENDIIFVLYVFPLTIAQE